MTEDLTPAPEDPYGIAKYAVCQELKATHAMFGLPYVIFRPHNVYGERQNLGDRYRNVIGIFMNQAMRGEPFTIFGDGRQQRAFTHVGDVAPAIARCIEREDAYGGIFNIGGDTPYTVNRLAEVVASAMGAPLRIAYLPARREVVDAYCSHDRARRVFGDLTRGISLEDGVARMAAWARQHGSREPSVFRGIEVWRGMPPSWRAVCDA
jgi:UDP-glucose 4-epimerase